MMPGKWPKEIENAINTEVAIRMVMANFEKDLEIQEKNKKIEKLEEKLEKKEKKHQKEKKKLESKIDELTVALCFEKYGEVEAPGKNNGDYKKEKKNSDDLHRKDRGGAVKRDREDGEYSESDDGYQMKKKRDD